MNLSRARSLALAAMAGALAAHAAAQGRYIIRYEGSDPLRTFLARNGLSLSKSVPNQPVHLAIDLQRRTAAQVMRDVEDDEEDAAIEADRRVFLPEVLVKRSPFTSLQEIEAAMAQRTTTPYFGVPSLTGYANQSAARMVQAPQARTQFGSGSAVVAVVDTGVDSSHSFFRGHLVSGYDFLRERAGLASDIPDLSAAHQALVNPTTTPLLFRRISRVNPTTTPLLERGLEAALASNPLPLGFGHGTMVAGAVRLVAPRARIMPLKAFGADGSGWLFDVVRSLYFAESKGARVINLSLSAQGPSPELERAVEFVDKQGVICVASAGNDGLLTDQVIPASISWVTGVASVAGNRVRSSFSNHGDKIVTISAPGEAMVLPYPGERWAGGWGTSFAAPLVSGTASLMFRVKPFATSSDLQSILSKAQPIPSATMGHGILDASSALKAL